MFYGQMLEKASGARVLSDRRAMWANEFGSLAAFMQMLPEGKRRAEFLVTLTPLFERASE
jgi:hypothetical protein